MDGNVEPRMRRVRTIRWVLVALMGCLGLFLLARGALIIGGFLVVMSVLRAVMLTELTRAQGVRMALRREAMARRRNRGLPPS